MKILPMIGPKKLPCRPLSEVKMDNCPHLMSLRDTHNTRYHQQKSNWLQLTYIICTYDVMVIARIDVFSDLLQRLFFTLQLFFRKCI